MPEHEGDPLLRVGEIDRRDGSAGLEHREDRDDQVDTARHREGHDVVAADAPRDEHRRERSHPRVQVGEGHLVVGCADRDRLRSGRDRTGERRRDVDDRISALRQGLGAGGAAVTDGERGRPTERLRGFGGDPGEEAGVSSRDRVRVRRGVHIGVHLESETHSAIHRRRDREVDVIDGACGHGGDRALGTCEIEHRGVGLDVHPGPPEQRWDAALLCERLSADPLGAPEHAEVTAYAQGDGAEGVCGVDPHRKGEDGHGHRRGPRRTGRRSRREGHTEHETADACCSPGEGGEGGDVHVRPGEAAVRGHDGSEGIRGLRGKGHLDRVGPTHSRCGDSRHRRDVRGIRDTRLVEQRTHGCPIGLRSGRLRVRPLLGAQRRGPAEVGSQAPGSHEHPIALGHPVRHERYRVAVEKGVVRTDEPHHVIRSGSHHHLPGHRLRVQSPVSACQLLGEQLVRCGRRVGAVRDVVHVDPHRGIDLHPTGVPLRIAHDPVPQRVRLRDGGADRLRQQRRRHVTDDVHPIGDHEHVGVRIQELCVDDAACGGTQHVAVVVAVAVAVERGNRGGRDHRGLLFLGASLSWAVPGRGRACGTEVSPRRPRCRPRRPRRGARAYRRCRASNSR